MKCLIFALLFILCGTTPRSYAAGVAQQFSQAKALYESGQLKAASEILVKIIKAYPGHKASYYLLGRIFYDSGKPRKAAKFFKKSTATFVSTGGGFAYGISMFTVRRYSDAIRGLKSVAKTSPMRNLAIFYMGVSYFNLRMWNKAQYALGRARNLQNRLKVHGVDSFEKPANAKGARVLGDMYRQVPADLFHYQLLRLILAGNFPLCLQRNQSQQSPR